MAALTRLIRDIILRALEDEDKGGSLHDQMEGFRQVLLHSLKPDEFADVYAQTIYYGLFAARCNYDGGQPCCQQKNDPAEIAYLDKSRQPPARMVTAIQAVIPATRLPAIAEDR